MEIILKNHLSHVNDGLGFGRPMRTGAPFSEKTDVGGFWRCNRVFAKSADILFVGKNLSF